MNIERGLLWNQENAVNRGIQANYSAGPVAISVSWNDGMLSNKCIDVIQADASQKFISFNFFITFCKKNLLQFILIIN